MLYVIAFLLPPVAIAMQKRWGHFILNILLCLCLWLPGSIHALFVTYGYMKRKQEAERQELLEAVRQGKAV